MTDQTTLRDPGEIELNHHGVIEASAGTGKTYTIEHLVLRILLAKRATLDQILVVTYTEKATSEMALRIRRLIETILREQPKHAALLQPALDNFDSAAIFTIHGFCRRVLRQYAFENRQVFNLELAADDDLLPMLLRRRMREAWPSELGEALPRVLHLAGFPGKTDDDTCEWETPVLRLAGLYNAHAGDRVLPEPNGSIVATLAALDDRVRAAADDLLHALPPVGSGPHEENELIKRYAQGDIHKSSVKARTRDILLPLLALLQEHQAQPIKLERMLAFVKRASGCSGFKDHGFAVLSAGTRTKKAQSLEQVCPEVTVITRVLEVVRVACQAGDLSHRLAADTIRALRTDLVAHKAEQGMMSFDDMLRLVDQALDGPSGEMLCGVLRERFRYVLVDEFQDTDRVQWNIFSKLFLGEQSRLYLIGDPKQAIYGFRGADVRTYLRARETLLKRRDAQGYSLAVNWRSTKPLVSALNHLFTAGNWFAPDERIGYVPVEASPKAKTPVPNRPALQLVRMSPDLTNGQARLHFYKYLAAEIARLKGRLELPDEERTLNYDDVAVLVRGNREADMVAQALSAMGIPYSHYKKARLFQSEEADHLSYVLEAVSTPGNAGKMRKALLTRFFRVPLEQVAHYDDLTFDHPLRQLFRRWHDLALDRDWPRLFQSLLEDTLVLLDPPGGTGEPDLHRERRATNYRHLLQELELAAARERLDMLGLARHFQHLRRQSVSVDEDVDMQRLETELPKVRIMTMHAAKGLQFSVVFLAGGFTSFDGDDYYKLHDDDGHVVYDLAKSDDNQGAHDEEQAAEDRRLYYVALTRAVHLLYLPYFRSEARGSAHRAGPVGGMIFDAIQSAGMHQRPANEVGVVTTVVDGGAAPRDDAGRASATPVELPHTLFPGQALPDVRHRRIDVTSFSALRDHAQAGMRAVERGVTFEAPTPREDEPDRVAMSAAPMEVGPLPPGPDTGSMLHEVLEEIDFCDVPPGASAHDLLAVDHPVGEVIRRVTRAYRFLQPEQLEATAEIVRATLHAPLDVDGSSLRLCDVPMQDRLNELEFHFPLPRYLEATLADEREREGFLRGFIDLVFRCQVNGAPRYYLLDWKSNYLAGGYDVEAVRAAMDRENYHLQHQLYGIALLRWLRAVQPGFDFQRHFGGVFYLFLRGMNGVDDEHGVFFHRPADEEEILGHERVLHGLINGERRLA